MALAAYFGYQLFTAPKKPANKPPQPKPIDEKADNLQQNFDRGPLNVAPDPVTEPDRTNLKANIAFENGGK